MRALQPEEWVEDWHGPALRDISIRGLDAGVVTVCDFVFPDAAAGVTSDPVLLPSIVTRRPAAQQVLPAVG